MAAAGHEGGEDLEGMPVEALLGMDMAHPNVVQTYRHTSLPSAVSLPCSLCNAACSLHHAHNTMMLFALDMSLTDACSPHLHIYMK